MATKTERPDNVCSRLLTARKLFAEANVKKTGLNRHFEFKYFELTDIVPVATDIGYEVGLLFITSFDNEFATMTVVNVDNMNENIVFRSPMKDIDSIESKSGGRITNAIQNLGSVETYQRRYLYMIALDIVEKDTFDAETGETEVPVPEKPKKESKPKAPVTPEKREEIKKEVVNSNGQAEPLQIEALKNLMQKVLEVAPDYEDSIQQIVLQTDKLTNVTKSDCEKLIKGLSDVLEAYETVEEE